MNGVIGWFVRNSKAANLLMIMIFIGGVFGIMSVGREVFPSGESNTVAVDISYPGAGPAEVEQQVTVRVEQAITDIKGIKEVSSFSRRSHSTVRVEATEGYDELRLLNDIKVKVDSINTFPEDIERPVVAMSEWEQEMMHIALGGDVSERQLKETAVNLRDRLVLLRGVRQVDIWGERADEMSIEVSEVDLRRYNLSFDDVANAVRRSSLDLPAGTIRSDRGDIQVQTRGQAYTAREFGLIPVLSRPDGTVLLLRDVATIRDGFEEEGSVIRFNGKPAMNLRVLQGEPLDVVATAERVRAFVEEVRKELPQGMQLEIWSDNSNLYADRMGLLLKNAAGGLVLVFLMLMLFLRPALAVWVTVGIATAFMGALWLLPLTGVTLNMLSLFAFLLILGIVVDDAIIVGEAVHAAHDNGMRGLAAAEAGVKQVAKPVIFAVVSTMVFFLPMLFLPGGASSQALTLGAVVLLCLLFSLVESLLILPAHLSGLQPEKRATSGIGRRLQTLRGHFAGALSTANKSYYQPLLDKTLDNSRVTVAVFFFALLTAVFIYKEGYLKTSFFPDVASDMLRLNASMAAGESFEEAERVMKQFVAAADRLEQDEEMLSKNGGPFLQNSIMFLWRGNIYVNLQLVPGEERNVSPKELALRWREYIGELPGNVEDMRIVSSISNSGPSLALHLSTGSGDMAELRRAADAVKAKLASYQGLYDVRDNLSSARQDIEIELKPYANNMGVTLGDVARQVRQGFYGEEVQRIPRGSEDVRVMVRYPQEERAGEDQIDRVRIRTSEGEVPFSAVADAVYVPGFTTIRRNDRERSVRITADIEPGTTESFKVLQDLRKNAFPEWEREYPGFSLKTAGQMRDQREFNFALAAGFILSVFTIYALLAIAFRSYSQPLLILTAVPFGFFGGIVGHLITGYDISLMSMLGFLAAAGVVVNDNLVLMDRINQLRDKGMEVLDAVKQAGTDRFRPIILTSITTFVGLVPIMFERSLQAKFLIPMVVSLAFGVLFATAVTLILVPNLYKVIEILRAKVHGPREHTEELSGTPESA
ncbi:AcrB/AcrD/AcrF family protein [Microbulbifer flavimaris]|uniref:AcrB/AcrD/AcrF family protein n=1 Tax=Microbulbifer flavimaris TaxID=1781068 RepID=A0ABX4I0J3_9GAMM|nr:MULTISPECIES: efflux RND transporter permease subunit [Microbulbifer]KUJ83756.1 acriflavin resistance protein [Microbulbifer sp. ZGT114]PCO05930.1 AcrB/AcrD/AcrF family protein [Microbulbifer flavimaris]